MAFAGLAPLADVPPANGAFYCFPRVNTSMNSMTVTERLIREHKVAVVPGAAFGMTDGCYVRVAYGALQKETVAKGIAKDGIRDSNVATVRIDMTDNAPQGQD